MRELTDFELSLVSGGFGGCDEAEGEEINICGYPPPDTPSYPPSPPPPGSYDPPVGSPPSSGPGTPPPPPCDLVDGEAIDFVNDTMKATHPPAPGPVDTSQFSLTNPNWLHAEFIGFMGPNGQIGQTVINVGTGGWSPNFANFVGDVQGYTHNHPAFLMDGNGNWNERSTYEKNDNRYPSSGDWATLQGIANHYGTQDPSLYLVDPYGTLREFKLSERSAIEGLTATDRQNGIALAGKEPTPPTCPH